MKYLDSDIKDCLLESCFAQYEYPWELISNLKNIIKEIKLTNKYKEIKEGVYAHVSAQISESATIVGPCIIGKNVKILPNVYIRENVILEDDCFVGHSVEIKNSLIMKQAILAHFNYVGDSIIGSRSHLGAGVIISNYRLDHNIIKVNGISTNVDKFGACIGDDVEIGCNSVINPGSIVPNNSHILPLTSYINKK